MNLAKICKNVMISKCTGRLLEKTSLSVRPTGEGANRQYFIDKKHKLWVQALQSPVGTWPEIGVGPITSFPVILFDIQTLLPPSTPLHSPAPFAIQQMPANSWTNSTIYLHTPVRHNPFPFRTSSMTHKWLEVSCWQGLPPAQSRGGGGGGMQQWLSAQRRPVPPSIKHGNRNLLATTDMCFSNMLNCCHLCPKTQMVGGTDLQTVQ